MSKINCNPKDMEVLLKDQTTEVIGLLFHQLVQGLSIVNNTNIDDNDITISVSSTPPTVGNAICIKEDTHFYQGHILSSTPSGDNYIITVDTLLDYTFTTSANICESNCNMAVDGSVTPQIFKISPVNLNDVKWDITGISGSITDQSQMDDNTFGGISALNKGIILRMSDGIKKNIANIKTNGSLKLHTFNVDYSDKAPAGYYGLNFYKELAGQHNNGVVIRLSSDDSGELQIIVQDDLSDLDSVHAVAHGHVTVPEVTY